MWRLQNQQRSCKKNHRRCLLRRRRHFDTETRSTHQSQFHRCRRTNQTDKCIQKHSSFGCIGRCSRTAETRTRRSQLHSSPRPTHFQRHSRKFTGRAAAWNRLRRFCMVQMHTRLRQAHICYRTNLLSTRMCTRRVEVRNRSRRWCKGSNRTQ